MSTFRGYRRGGNISIRSRVSADLELTDAIVTGTRDDHRERIRDLLPGQEGHVGVTAADTGCSSRRCCIAIALVCRGAICRSASATGRTRISASSRWAKSGVWERVFRHLG